MSNDLFDEKEMKMVEDEIEKVNKGAIVDRDKLLNWYKNYFDGASKEAIQELSSLLFDVNQLLDGFSGDDTWSEWDESVKKRVWDMFLKVKSHK